MNFRALLLLPILLLVAGAASAASKDTRDLSARANARAESGFNVERFIEETNTAVDLAAQGGYGPLRRGQMDRLEDSRNTIVRLLDGRSSAVELGPEARLELYNAQETITAILRNEDKDRVVCTKGSVTGTRLAKTECMTVAERELRARIARESADRFQRVDCIPGEASRCGR
jgi:hypothetical protein